MNIDLVGERLKKIRQEKGFSLEDIQKKTKVHINILKAIEGETLTNLSPVYLKSFIKIYCKALGVEPKDYIPDFKETVAKVAIAPSGNTRHSVLLNKLGSGIGLLARNKRFLKNILLVVAVFFFLALILKSAGCVVSRIKSSLNSRPAQRDVAAPAALKTGKARIEKPKVLPVGLPKDASGQIRLVISAKDNCLVYVKADGRVVFHRVLEKGRSDTWKAKDKIELTLSNPWAVEIIVNGQRFTNLGKRGQPLKNIVITEKEGLRISR